MPMHPSPSAETVRPSVPSRRCCMASSLLPGQTLEQLDLPCVIEVVGGDPIDVCRVAPLRTPAPVPELSGVETGDDTPQQQVLVFQERAIPGPGRGVSGLGKRRPVAAPARECDR